MINTTIVIALIVSFLVGVAVGLAYYFLVAKKQRPKQTSFTAASYAFNAAEEVVDDVVKVFNAYTKKHEENTGAKFAELRTEALRLARATAALRSAVDDLLIGRTAEERVLPPANPTEFQTKRFLQLQAIESCVHQINAEERRINDKRLQAAIAQENQFERYDDLNGRM